MSNRRKDPKYCDARDWRFNFTPQEYNDFTSFIESKCGLTFSPFKKREFQLKLNKLDKGLADSVYELMEAVTVSDDAFQKVINVLTVGESFFFRNRPHFNALSTHIIPELMYDAEKRRTLNIWCAGCARGEEPYSLAMLIHERFPLLKDWDLSVVATDINSVFLEDARKGIYRKWAFRGVEDTVIQRFFHQDAGGDLRLHQNIKKAVDFKHFNLIELLKGARPMAGNLDLVLCRNVLIYFPFETSDKLVNAFREMIRPGGYLLVGHSEAFPALGNFEVIYSNATYYYRKHSDQRTAAMSMPAGATQAIPGIGVRTTLAPPPFTPVTRESPPPIDVIEPREEEGVKAEGLGNDPNHVLEKARTLADQGQSQKAVELLTAVSEDGGRLDYRVHFMMALLADHTGDVARAVESLKRAIFLRKGFVVGHYYLGVICHREGDTAIAKRHFKNVIRLLESVPDDQMLDESEGLNAGRLKEIVTARYEELNLV